MIGMFGILIFSCLCFWVLYPLWRLRDQRFLDFSADQFVLEQLKEKKALLMQSLKDLDHDYQTGKLSKEDYQKLQRETRDRTIVILEKIDQEQEKWDAFNKDWDTHAASKS